MPGSQAFFKDRTWSWLTNCSLEQYYSAPVAYAGSQSAVREIFQPDVLYIPFDFASTGASYGRDLRMVEQKEKKRELERQTRVLQGENRACGRIRRSISDSLTESIPVAAGRRA